MFPECRETPKRNVENPHISVVRGSRLLCQRRSPAAVRKLERTAEGAASWRVAFPGSEALHRPTAHAGHRWSQAVQPEDGVCWELLYGVGTAGWVRVQECGREQSSRGTSSRR